MKTKANKKSGAFIWAVAAVLAIFLCLPILFSDEVDNVLVAQDEEITGSLPIIISENPLSKYFRKASSFYGFGKVKAGKGVLPPAPEQEYTEEEREQMLASFARAKIAQQKKDSAEEKGGGTIVWGEDGNDVLYKSSEGIVVQPDAKGYYYDGKYYKNGTYPSPALKRSIESSINKFHSSQAAKDSKNAVYVQEEDGTLVVKYIPKKSFDKLKSNNYVADEEFASSYINSKRTANTINGGNNRANSGDSGIRILSKNSSGGGGSSSRSASGGRDGNSSAGLFGDFGALFASANASHAQGGASQIGVNGPGKNNSHQHDAGQNGQDNGNGHSHGYHKIAQATKPFQSRIFSEPAKEAPPPRPYEKKFEKAPMVMENYLQKRFDREFGLTDDKIDSTQEINHVDIDDGDVREFSKLFRKADTVPFKVFTASKADYDTLREKASNEYHERRGRELSVLSPQERAAEEARRNLRATGGSNYVDARDPNIFVGYPLTPYTNPAKKGEDTITDTFFVRTGLADVMSQMNYSEEEIATLRKKYERLDEVRTIAFEELKNSLERNRDTFRSLHDFRPSVTYILGRDEENSNNIIVATERSFLTSNNPNLVNKRLLDRYPSENAYVSVPINTTVPLLREKGSVVVVTTPQAATALKENGVRTVLEINEEKLASIDPKSLGENGEAVRRAVGKELASVVTTEQKAVLEKEKERMAQIIKASKQAKQQVDGPAKGVYTGPGSKANMGPAPGAYIPAVSPEYFKRTAAPEGGNYVELPKPGSQYQPPPFVQKYMQKQPDGANTAELGPTPASGAKSK